MARIRSIKPDFFTSPQLASCSRDARLLFIGMWCFCDDSGIHHDDVRRLKMEVFPGDDCTIQQIEQWIGELIAVDLINKYTVEGSHYLLVTGWKHQKIDQPTYRYPLPDGKIPVDYPRRRTTSKEECSANVRRVFGECSPPESKGVEGNGVESKGMEGSGVERNGVERNGVERNLKGSSSFDQSRTGKIQNEEFWEEVRLKANVIVKKIGIHPKNAADRTLVLKACALVHEGVMSEGWLIDSVEALRLSKCKKQSPWGYWYKCLSNKSRDVGKDLSSLFRSVQIPTNLIDCPTLPTNTIGKMPE